MAKGYKTITGLLRYGMGMPKAAKDVAKLIKGATYKCKVHHYYTIKTYCCGKWLTVRDSNGNEVYFLTLKMARKEFNSYKKEYPDCLIVKITESEEIIAASGVHNG